MSMSYQDTRTMSELLRDVSDARLEATARAMGGKWASEIIGTGMLGMNALCTSISELGKSMMFNAMLWRRFFKQPERVRTGIRPHRPNRTRKKQRLTRLQRRTKRQKR